MKQTETPPPAEALQSGLVTGEISQIGDAVHLEFSGAENWPYEILRREDGLVLEVPALSLGIINKLKSWSGPLVKVESIRPGTDERHAIQIKLKDPKVQLFDYLSDKPSRLIVDFFLGDKAVGKKEEHVGKTENKAQTKRLVQALPKKGARKPASTEFITAENDGANATKKTVEARQGVFDGNDPNFDRFDIKDYEISERAIIASRRDVFMPYPPLRLARRTLHELWETPPVYEISAENDKENRQARLLITLFNNKRRAVFLKTLEMFKKEFPKSRYDQIIGYLEADVHYELWRQDDSASEFELAMTLYRGLVEKYPESPLAERTQQLIGYSFLERGQALGVLQAFDRYWRLYPTSSKRWAVKMTMAEAYQLLNRNDEARATLQEIMKDPLAGDFGVEASYRIGDTYFQEKKFDQAIAEYQRAMDKDPAGRGQYPNADFNMSEAKFWKQQYRESLKGFREFLIRNPSHGHGGYAMTRIGELLGILGADPQRVLGAFLECQFRYSSNPGAKIAKSRILRSRMPVMKEKEIETGVAEIMSFAKESPLPRIHEYATVVVADGYHDRKEFVRAEKILIDFYQANPTSADLDVIRERIVKNQVIRIGNEIDRGDFVEAFRLFGKNSSTWLKKVDRTDLIYFLAKGFEEAGAYSDAEKFYSRAINRLYAERGTAQGKEREVFERLPTEDTLNLRLAAIRAKMDDYSKSASYLKAVRAPASLNPEERLERAGVEAKVREAMGDLDGAKKSLTVLLEADRTQPTALAPLLLQLADLEFRRKNWSEALKATSRIAEFAGENPNFPTEYEVRSAMMTARIHEASGAKEKAIEAYRNIIEEFDKGEEVSQSQYELGRLLYEQGNLTEAEKIWANLNQPETQFWYKLANEKVKQSRFEDDYKKYIQRIPAMSGSNQQGAKK